MKIKFFMIWLLSAFFCGPVFANGQAPDLKLSADAALRAGRTPEAIEAYGLALQYEPAFKEAFFNLAVALYTDGQFEPAAASLENLVRLSPNDTEALYNLACLKLRLGDVQQALAYFQRAQLTCASDSRFRPLIEDGVRSIFSRLVSEAPKR